MSLEAGVTFCVVCGRFDRELVQRRSGLKCLDCVGRRSKREYAHLQQQQATYVLMTVSQSSPKSAGSPKTSMASAVPPDLFTLDERERSTAGSADRKPINLEEIVVTVETPVISQVAAESFLPFRSQRAVTHYAFVTRRKYCPHDTVAAKPAGFNVSFSLMCPECCRPVAVTQQRFSSAVRVFETLKAIGRGSLPPLPEKKIFAKASPEVLEQRRCSLESFAISVAADPFLVRHPQFLELLGIRDEPSRGIVSSAASLEDEIEPKALRGWKKGVLLGKGSFGSVFLGLLPSSQLVAVKVVRLGSVESGEMDVLQAELGILRRLRHKNIVRLLGSLCNNTSGDGELCIFTEYVEVGSIARMVRKFGPLPMSVIQRYMRQILAGLAYLHDQDIVHRDIKGDNILVGKDGCIKLADFGCSAVLHRVADVDVPPGTLPNLAGTPLWMSPEAMRGETLTSTTDIWSVGCVGIEMLGNSPWKMGKTENVFTAMFRFQRAEHFPDGFPTEDSTPASYKDFLALCFNRNPEERPSAKQLLAHPFFEEDFVGSVEDDIDVAESDFVL